MVNSTTVLKTETVQDVGWEVLLSRFVTPICFYLFTSSVLTLQLYYEASQFTEEDANGKINTSEDYFSFGMEVMPYIVGIQTFFYFTVLPLASSQVNSVKNKYWLAAGSLSGLLAGVLVVVCSFVPEGELGIIGMLPSVNLITSPILLACLSAFFLHQKQASSA